MYNRADARLVAFRKKKGRTVPKGKEDYVSLIENLMEPGDKWDNFSERWDILVTPKEVKRAEPEKDEMFIANTIVEIKTKLSLGVSIEEIEENLSDRERNLYNIIEVNYLGPVVKWEEYNDTWGVSLENGTGFCQL